MKQTLTKRAKCNLILELVSSERDVIFYTKKLKKKGYSLLKKVVKKASLPNIDNVINSVAVIVRGFKNVEPAIFQIKIL